MRGRQGLVAAFMSFNQFVTRLSFQKFLFNDIQLLSGGVPVISSFPTIRLATLISPSPLLSLREGASEPHNAATTASILNDVHRYSFPSPLASHILRNSSLALEAVTHKALAIKHLLQRP